MLTGDIQTPNTMGNPNVRTGTQAGAGAGMAGLSYLPEQALSLEACAELQQP